MPLVYVASKPRSATASVAAQRERGPGEGAEGERSTPAASSTGNPCRNACGSPPVVGKAMPADWIDPVG